MSAYSPSGIVQTVVLWTTRDFGYLAVYASVLAAQGRIPRATESIDAGTLGAVKIRDTEAILGAPMLFNKGNIDRYNF